MNKAKTIKIFLLNGEPTGTKTIELSNWNGKSYFIPRNQLDELAKDTESQKELNSQCVYLLTGNSGEGKAIIYVGEAENFLTRIGQHNRNKDFWNLAICFITKDENLTKSHVKYLEFRLIQKIKKANRATLKNSTEPLETKLPRSERAEMEVFLENIEILLSSLGLTFTNKLKSEKKQDIFYCKNNLRGDRGGNGTGMLTNEGFVVFKNSIIAKEEVPSLDRGTSVTRFLSETNNELKLLNGKHILREDKFFSSPSYAASFILGRNANGWYEWKTKSGITLDELKRKSKPKP